MAHRIADDIVEAVEGKVGIASSSIIMVGAKRGKQDIYMCGADGQGLSQLTKDGAPCLSPNWGSDAQKIYYTSLRTGYPDVYEIALQGFKRRRVSKYPGINSGAAVSPDGRRMALTLSKDGNPDLYVRDLGDGRPERITRTPRAAEASPSWSPDGRKIVFVSDRTGSPQLYVASRSGKETRRITLRGRENVSPDWGPHGVIAYSSRREGRYQICIVDPKDGKEKQITSDGADHEDPSWAPDGRHIIYVRTVNYRSALYVLDTLGDPEIRFMQYEGDWYSPAWSPR